MKYTIKHKIYTDGACSGNPGPGGYSFVIVGEGAPLVVSGYKEKTTNNQMELTAIVRGLAHIAKGMKKTHYVVTIYSDSAYCLNALTQGWVNMWALNEWNTKGGKPVKNVELWKKYLEIRNAYPNMKVDFVKVKGHSGDKYNEMADNAAKQAIVRHAKPHKKA